MTFNSEISKIIREAELEDKYELVQKKDPQIERRLSKIKNNYKTQAMSYSMKCEGTAKHLLMTILTDAELKKYIQRVIV